MSEQVSGKQLIEQLQDLVSDRNLSVTARRECIGIAYQLGLVDGRVEGSVSMGNHMTASMEKAMAQILKVSA